MRRAQIMHTPPRARVRAHMRMGLLLRQRPLTRLNFRVGSLASNALCGLVTDQLGRTSGTYTAEGFTKLCEAVKGSSITSLEYAALLPQKRLLSCQRPLTE